jgi:hypothetical protein
MSGRAQIRLCVVILALSVTANIAFADILLDGNAAGLVKRRVFVDYVFSGLTGDPILLNDGTHTVSVDGDHNTLLLMQLRTSGGQASIVSTSTEVANCRVGGATWKVSGWSVPTLSALEGHSVTILTLAKPSYSITNNGQSCSPSSMIGPPRHMNATLTSVPAGAEIYVNGERVPGNTNITISVPFMQGEASRNLLLRLDGYRPCQNKLVLVDGTIASVNCVLTKP